MNAEKLKEMYKNVLWNGKPRSFLGMPLNCTTYVLTDKKLCVRQGFLNIKEEQIELYRIVDLSISIPLGQRIFGCGTINIKAKDASSPSFSLRKIKDPYKVHNLLEESINAQKKEYNVQGKDMYGVSTEIE